MNLMKYGYKKEEIKIRKMTMAELRLGIVQELLKKNYRYVNVRLVNTTCGEVDSFRSTEDFLMAGYNEGYEWKADFKHEKGFLPEAVARAVNK